MKNQFVLPDDPILTRRAKKIPLLQVSSAKTQAIIKLMLKIAAGGQKDITKPIMVGLAAPQIGILKRIILVDVAANGKGRVGNLRIYINPEIIWKSQEEEEWYEGCFSTNRICGIVSRPFSIQIKAFTTSFPLDELASRSGWERTFEKHTGYTARIFQHEIDHLNGIRFPDHITDPSKLHWVKKSEFPLYRNRQAWRNWPRKYSFEKWLKSGKS